MTRNEEADNTLFRLKEAIKDILYSVRYAKDTGDIQERLALKISDDLHNLIPRERVDG